MTGYKKGVITIHYPTDESNLKNWLQDARIMYKISVQEVLIDETERLR